LESRPEGKRGEGRGEEDFVMTEKKKKGEGKIRILKNPRRVGLARRKKGKGGRHHSFPGGRKSTRILLFLWPGEGNRGSDLGEKKRKKCAAELKPGGEKKKSVARASPAWGTRNRPEKRRKKKKKKESDRCRSR